MLIDKGPYVLLQNQVKPTPVSMLLIFKFTYITWKNYIATQLKYLSLSSEQSIQRKCFFLKKKQLQ